MTAAAVGSVVSTTMADWPDFPGRAGDVMRSQGGSLYEIIEVRWSRPGSKSSCRVVSMKLPPDTELEEEPIEFWWNVRS